MCVGIKILTFLSCSVYMILSATSLHAIIGNLIFTGLFAIILVKLPIQIVWHDFLNLKYILFSIPVAILDSLGFYSKLGSPSILYFTDLLGINRQVFIILVCFLGIIASIPFLAFIIHLFINGNIINAENLNNYISSKKFYHLCLFISLAGIIFQIIGSFNITIRMDSAASLIFIKEDYDTIVRITAGDVHPPLYYFILKFLFNILDNLFLHKIHYIYIGKLISVIPIAAILILLIFAAKKSWLERYTAGISALCLVGITNISYYSAEIRMYSWAALFVFSAYLVYSRLLHNTSFVKWGLFLMCSLASAYTHYYALLAVAFMYMMLFVYYVRHNKENLLSWFVVSLTTCVAYIPWIKIALSQLKSIDEYYYITSVSVFDIIQYVKYLFFGFLFAVVFIICLVRFYKVLENKTVLKEKGYAVFTAVFIPIWITFIGIIVSVLYSPVFTVRYMIPGLLCLWIGIAAAVDLVNDKRERIVYTGLIFAICLSGIIAFAGIEAYDTYNGNVALNYFNRNKGTNYITDIYLNSTVSQMSGETCYIIGDYGNIESQDVERMLKHGEKVSLVVKRGSNPKDTLFLENLEYSLDDSFTMEIPVDLYQMEIY